MSAKSKPAQIETGGALYPNLLSDYSVISMVTEDDNSVQKLLPKAKELSTSLSSNTTYLEKLVHTSNKGVHLLKIHKTDLHVFLFNSRTLNTPCQQCFNQNWKTNRVCVDNNYYYCLSGLIFFFGAGMRVEILYCSHLLKLSRANLTFQFCFICSNLNLMFS